MNESKINFFNISCNSWCVLFAFVIHWRRLNRYVSSKHENRSHFKQTLSLSRQEGHAKTCRNSSRATKKSNFSLFSSFLFCCLSIFDINTKLTGIHLSSSHHHLQHQFCRITSRKYWGNGTKSMMRYDNETYTNTHSIHTQGLIFMIQTNSRKCISSLLSRHITLFLDESDGNNKWHDSISREVFLLMFVRLVWLSMTFPDVSFSQLSFCILYLRRNRVKHQRNWLPVNTLITDDIMTGLQFVTQ